VIELKKNGFTLIEMIAVVIIISLLALISLPTIMNQLANKKDEISDVTQSLIFEAAELYMSGKTSTYVKTPGLSYCVSLDDLVNQGYLSSPITDYKTGNEISLSNYVKTTINQYSEYDNFEITDTNC
jgi:prepilin-type N-terminal cleavage/methylation domain-containing protein